MEVNTDWKSLQILIFCGPEKAIKLAQKLNNKMQNSKTLSKVECMQMYYKKWLIWSAIGRSRYREVRSRG